VLFQQIIPATAETTDEVEFQDFTIALRRRWWIIAGMGLLAAALGFGVTMLAHPHFVATGSFYLDDSQASNNTNDSSFLSDYQVVSSVNTQVQLIQSPALLEQAVLETGLNAQITAPDYAPLAYWQWRFLQNKSISVFAPRPHDLVAVFARFSDPAARGGNFLLKFSDHGNYQLFALANSSSTPVTVLSGTLGQPAAGGGLSLTIKSADGGTTVPTAGSVYNASIIPAKTMAGIVAGSLYVQATGPAVSPTNVAQVQLGWANPYQATAFVDQLMQDFIQSQLAWKTQSASNTQNYISQQLKNIAQSLAQANQNQASYQSKTGIVDVNSNAQAVISQLSAYQSQRATLLLQQEALTELVKSLAAPDAAINPYLVSQANDPVLTGLGTTLANAQVTLRSQETQFTVKSQQVQQQLATISQIEGAIQTIVQNDESVATKNLRNLDTMIAQFQEELKAMPAESLQVNELSRSSDVLGTLYGLLMQKEEEAQVAKAAAIEDTRIISPAELPLSATAPRPALAVAAGLIFGLLAGFSIVIINRTLSRCYRSDAEIRRHIPLPTYGIIPKGGRRIRGMFSPLPTSAFAEAFRLLRANLYGMTSEPRLRVFMVTSPTAGDGRTIVAANIAKTLADDGKRVLLVDADLHCGDLASRLHLPPAPGLANWLLSKIRPPLLDVPGYNFKLLQAGAFPENPADLLNGQLADDIFAELRTQFDYVIVDTPAFPAVSDAMCLLRQMDLILTVASVDFTPRQSLVRHCETIGVTDTAHGLVINRVDPWRFAAGRRPERYRGARSRRRLFAAG
jgi:capsular exopolysaccharide synthesis family protein